MGNIQNVHIGDIHNVKSIHVQIFRIQQYLQRFIQKM